MILRFKKLIKSLLKHDFDFKIESKCNIIKLKTHQINEMLTFSMIKNAETLLI
jgi:hypothetical protein